MYSSANNSPPTNHIPNDIFQPYRSQTCEHDEIFRMSRLFHQHEESRQIERKDCIIVVETRLEISSQCIDFNISNSQFPSEYLISKKISPQFSIADPPINDPCRIKWRLGTTTIVVGGAARVRNFEDLIRLENERTAQKRLISKVSMIKLIDEFTETNFTNTLSEYRRQDIIFDSVHFSSTELSAGQHHTACRQTQHVQDRLSDFTSPLDKQDTAFDRNLKTGKTTAVNRSSHVSSLPKENCFVESVHHPNSQSQERNGKFKMGPSIISNAATSIYRTLTRRSKKPANKTGPISQRAERETQRDDDIREWVNHSEANQDWNSDFVDGYKSLYENDGEDGHYFMCCTPSQFQELSLETQDRVRVVKAYVGPPSTPCPERHNQEDSSLNRFVSEFCGKTSSNGQVACFHAYPLSCHTVEQIQDYADFAPLPSSAAYHRQAGLLGLRNYGLQVLGTDPKVNFESIENLSELYFLPFLEPAETTRSYYQPNPFTSAKVHFGHPSHQDEKSIIRKRGKLMKSTNANPNQDQQQTALSAPTLFPKRSQVPSHALILYLFSQGYCLESIALILSGLPDKFVYNWSSRWWEGVRIPDHWEFDSTTLNTIETKCRAEEQWWEQDAHGGGRSLRAVKERIRARKAGYLVRKVVENYLWERFSGVRVHDDVLHI